MAYLYTVLCIEIYHKCIKPSKYGNRNYEATQRQTCESCVSVLYYVSLFYFYQKQKWYIFSMYFYFFLFYYTTFFLYFRNSALPSLAALTAPRGLSSSVCLRGRSQEGPEWTNNLASGRKL